MSTKTLNMQQQYQKMAQEYLGVDYELEQMCVDCVLRRLENDINEHRIPCKPLEKGTIDDQIPQTKDDYLLKLAEDPAFFSKEMFEMELRGFQKEILYCTSRRKVLRICRRAGKTEAMAIAAIKHAITHKDQEILVAAPMESQVKNLFEKMNKHLINSEALRNSVIKQSTTKTRLYRSKPFELAFNNGSKIEGFTTGSQGAKNIRGQDGSMIVLDEVDYMNRPDIEAILAILATSPKTTLIASSTPSGRRDYFYQWCHSSSFKEIHYSYQDIEIYDPKQDREFKEQYDKEAYEREILAMFTLMESGVYRPDKIQQSIENYSFDDPYNVPEGLYTMGVDWNETAAGVQIVVVRYEPDKGKFRTCNVLEIPPSQFTQIEAVEKIIDLNTMYQPRKIMLDAGYGNTQFQMLQKHAEQHPESKLEERLEMIPFQSKVHLVDPATGNKVSRSIKTHMVSISARYVENNRIIMPASEDYPGKLVGIMRNYAIEKIGSNGEPQYSKGKVHILEAWILAMYGMWKISEDGGGFNMRNPIIVKTERDKNSKQSVRRSFRRSRGALDLSRGALGGRRRWT